MGYLINCNCKQCNNSWVRYQGEGMMAAFYHCDKCGKEISVQDETDSDWINSCDCGGSYNEAESPIICPECKSMDIETSPAGCWD